MDKQTLSHYGWIVIITLILATMLAFATPFGVFVGDGATVILGSYKYANNQALDENHVKQLSEEWDDKLGDRYYNHNDPALNPVNIEVEGETYSADEYTYTRYRTESSSYAWKVQLKIGADKSKTSYGPMLESINGEYVTIMEATFLFCNNMTESPVIPAHVQNIGSSFWGCTSLVVAPRLPDGLQEAESTFKDCTALKEPPKLPEGIRKVGFMFDGCTALESAPVVPDSVIVMDYMFNECTSLKGTVTVNAQVTSETYYRLFLTNCAKDADHAIVINGSCPSKIQLAQTAFNNGANVTVE